VESLRGRPGVCHETSLGAASERLSEGGVDAVATELFLPDACGLDAVLQLNRSHPQVPVLVIGDDLPEILVRQALAAGAQDVVTRAELAGGELARTLQFAIARQRSQASIHHEALHDELTRLAKRTLLQQRLSNALARSRRMGNTFAVIYVDLDHFKWINDTHGHHVGDAVLVAVSERLRSAVRDYDTVARLGGDEFAILLDTLDDSEEAERVAQRVLASLAQPIEMARREVRVTASLGVSVFPDGGSDGADLLRHADQAMYCAKRAGRNTYSLTPTVEDAALSRRGSLRPPSLRCSAGR
jgi:diguanylate cyclase (GGDEF)-like protein